MSGAVAIAAALAILGGSVEKRDELCSRLNHFERALVRSKAESNSVVMTYDWANWTVACSAGESGGGKLCSWLARHTSIEFPQSLIQRVSACYVPVEATVPISSDQTVNQTFRTEAGNRLQVDAQLKSAPDLPSVRLTMERAK